MIRFVKTSSRRGFTLAEVLVVVAVLAILLTFAAPPVIGAFIRMHLTSLDDSAFTIFAAAQNSLTTMVGNGELEHFADAVTTDHSISSMPEDFEPAASWTEYEPDMRYLDSGLETHRAALQKLLPGGSIEAKLAEHRYVVEYNAKTGAVYAVWYSDEEEFQDAPTFGYTRFAAGTDNRGYEDRLGHSPLIGYYGGSGIDYAGVHQMPMPALALTNAEALRLRITMPGTPAGAAGFDPRDIGLEITVTGKTSGKTLRLSDRTAGNQLFLDAGETGDLLLDTLDAASYSTRPVDEILNDKTYGMPFHAWTDVGTHLNELFPGEDITVTVTAYYAGTDNTKGPYLPQSASVICNSLFANVTTDAVTGAKTAGIAYGRHLQNLDADTSTGVYTGPVGGDASPITAAVQTQPIDFNAVNGTFAAGGSFVDGDDTNNIYYWAETYGTVDNSTGTVTANKSFTAIYNRALAAYNGNSLPIRNLVAAEHPQFVYPSGSISHSAGLFAWFGPSTASTLESITLIDASFGDGSTPFVGALAGVLGNTSINNCQVYLEEDKNPDTAPGVKGSSRVGGLVGRANFGTVSITNSFAATVVQQSSQYGLGGLVGEVSEHATCSILNSYAACHLRGGSCIGGLIGRIEGNVPSVTVSNSYAAGIIDKVTANATHGVGGLIGALLSPATTDISVTNSYAAVRYSEDFIADNATAAVPVYGTALNTAGHATFDKAYYVSQPDVTYDTNGGGTALNAAQLSEMENGIAEGYLDDSTDAWYHLPAEKGGDANPTYATFPYRQSDETNSLSTPYPYPQLLDPNAPTGGGRQPMLHYGDWLELPAGSMFYGEKYEGPAAGTYTYGFYGYLNEEGGALVDTLRKGDTTNTDLEYAVEDGYGFLVRQGAGGSSVCPGDIAAENGTLKPVMESTGDYKVYKGAYSRTNAAGVATTYDFYFYTFEPDPAATFPATQYYRSVTLSGQEYWFNTDFACEIVRAPAGTTIDTAPPQGKAGAAGAEGGVVDTADYSNQVVIRTARQLAFMAVYTNGENTNTILKRAAQRWTWNQLLDIDNAAYTGAITAGGTGTGTGSMRNVGTEDNPQRPAALTLGKYEGCNYRIKNLYLGSYESGSTTYAGLFGQLSGTGTAVNDLTLDTVTVNCPAASSSYTGALAGVVVNSASITNCTVVDGTVTAVAINSYGAYVGALAGGFNGSGTVTNCGAYVSPTGNYTRNKVSVSVSGSGSGANGSGAGGLIGVIRGGTVSNSYAAVQVTYTTSCAGGFAGHMGGGTVTNCYAGGHTEGGVYKADADSINVQGYYAGGFVGYYVDATFGGVCYSTCSVRTTSTANVSHFVGMFVGCGGVPTKPSGTNEMLYAAGATFGNDYRAVAPRAENYLTPLIPDITRTGAWFTTDHYDTTLTDYPYPSNLAAHHGDWGARLALLYYEAYNSEPTTTTTGTPAIYDSASGKYYGFYGTLPDGTKVSSLSILDTAKPVDSGYAVASALDLGREYSWQLFADTAGTTVSASGKARTAGTGTGTDVTLKLGQATLPGLPARYVYTLPDAALDQAPAGTYYRAIAVNGIAAAFNPWFACEALNAPNGKGTTKEVTIGSNTYTYTETGYDPDAISAKTDFVPSSSTDSKDVLIRTPRNLAAMARYTRGSNSDEAMRDRSRTWNYTQLLDLDFDGVYTGTVQDSGTATTGVGTRTAPLAPAYLSTGTYDGSDKHIENLWVGATTEADEDANDPHAAGLFSNLGNGTAKTSVYTLSQVGHLALDMLRVQADDDTAYTGGVAAYINQGSLEDVTVNTAEVTLTDRTVLPATDTETCVGGLAGYAFNASTLQQCTGVNLTVDAKASVTGNARVGGLIGRLANGSEAQDCGLYADANYAVITGGASSTVATSGDAYDNTGVTFADGSGTTHVNNDYVGGFAGDINGSTVTDCYAAVKVTGKKYVGGFAGQLNGATANDCYSGGRVFNGSGGYDYADPTAPATTNEANVTGTARGAHVGGFAGQAAGTVTLDGICYTTCSVYSRQNTKSDNEQYMGLFFGAMSKGSNGSVTVTSGSGNMVYAGGSYFGQTGADAIRNEEAYGLLSGPGLHDAGSTGTPATAETYGITGTGSSNFPYSTNLSVHHGDWRQPVTYAGALYWEKERTAAGADTYNFAVAATDSLGQTYTVDLPDHGHDGTAVTEWGYGYFNVGDVTVGTDTVPALSVTNTTPAAPYEPLTVIGDINTPPSSAGYDRYYGIRTAFQQMFGSQGNNGAFTLWEGTKLSAPTKADDLSIIVEENTAGTPSSFTKTFALNRAFAAAMEDVSGAASPTLGTTADDPYQIRTLDQLANANDANGLYFKQAHDLNMSAHNDAVTTDYTHTPLTLTGGYDGDGYRIIDLSVSAAGDAGLFGTLTGEVGLQNIVLYAPDARDNVTIRATGGYAAGGLVGAVQGSSANVTVTNCAVAGYTVSAENDTAGGLAGSVTGTLTVGKSQAVVDLRQNSNNGGLGGLVGSVGAGGSLDIANSYAGGRVVNAMGALVGTAPDYAGGLIGAVDTSAASEVVSRSYAYMSGTANGIAPAPASATSCAYLSKDGQTGAGDGKATNEELAQWFETLTGGTPPTAVYGTAAANATYVPTNEPTGFAKGNGLDPNDGTAAQPAFPFGAAVTDPHLEGQVDDDTGLPLDAHVHYGTWPDDSPSGFVLSNSTLKDALALMVVYNDGTKVVWFAADNPDRPATGDIRMWDSSNQPMTIGTTLPTHTAVADIALIAKGAKFYGTGGVKVSTAAGTSESDSFIPNNRKLQAFLNSSSSRTSLQASSNTSYTSLPDALADYRDAIRWFNVASFNYGDSYAFADESKTYDYGTITLSIPSGMTEAAPPVESGPEIFDTLYCTCTVKCTEGHVKEYCPLCHADYTQCQAPEATPTPTPEPTPAPTPETVGGGVPDAPQGTPEPTVIPEPAPTPEPAGGVPDTPQGTPEPSPTPEPPINATGGPPEPEDP